MDIIRDNMKGKPCGQCGTIIYPGDWHHCPTENAISIAKKDNEINRLQSKLKMVKDRLELIKSAGGKGNFNSYTCAEIADEAIKIIVEES